MEREQQNFRPYASPSNVIAVIQRARSRNLPESITNDFLRIAGIGDAVFGRVTQALRFLNLVHEDGRPTDKFEALAGATESQYRELLEAVIREAYRKEFEVIDPGQDIQPKVVDAFSPYQPRSQTSRMVMLFLGLCREAGIPVLDAPRERSMKESTVRRPRQESPKGRKQTEQPIIQTGRQAEQPITPANSVLFPLTEDDVGFLSDDEFNEVWAALGKVARARARARQQPQQKEIVEEKSEEEEEGEKE